MTHFVDFYINFTLRQWTYKVFLTTTGAGAAQDSKKTVQTCSKYIRRQ